MIGVYSNYQQELKKSLQDFLNLQTLRYNSGTSVGRLVNHGLGTSSRNSQCPGVY